MQQTDVVVVGAGPSGSTIAGKIAREGFDVLLIEKDRYPGEKNICGGCISNALFEILKLDKRIIDKKIAEVKYYFPWGMIYSEANSEFVNIDRKIFDNALAEKAVENGANLITSTRLIDFTLDKHYVTSYIHNKTGEENIQSKIIVFADGPNTLISKKTNGAIGFKSTSKNAAIGMINEIEWKNNPLCNNEFFFDNNLAEWGYGWIFPNRHKLNIGIMSLSKQGIRKRLEYMKKSYPLTSMKLNDMKTLRSAAALIPLGQSKQIYGNSILVAGDAAGMVNPLWGEGIAFAIKSGQIAADVAISALQENNFKETFLSRYQKEWEKTEEYRVLNNSINLNRIFMGYSKFDKLAYAKLRLYMFHRDKSDIITSFIKAIMKCDL